MTVAAPRRAVVCGAGIAGCAPAWRLCEAGGVTEVVLVDERAPLSLTSDKSTECYRNWWPGPGAAMTALTNHSIDLMESLAADCADRFRLNRRGYLFATASEATAQELEARATVSCALGAGPLRIHRAGGGAGGDSGAYQPASAHGWERAPAGADVIHDRAMLRAHFPWLTGEAVAVLHVRRAGWLSAQQLGMELLDRARARGTRLLRGRVTAVDTRGGRVRAVTVETPRSSERIEADVLVNAAGPYARAVARLLGLDLPILCEGHVKVAFDDRLGAVPRDAPLMLWCDPVVLPFSGEEREALAASPQGRALLAPFPAGVHGRPEGAGSQVLIYWTYERESIVEPRYPIHHDPRYPEIALRGMSVMVPALARYADALPRPFVDGGYYAKTPDNQPLIGPLGVSGAFAMAAFSGYGIMAALGASEVLAAHVSGSALPGWAGALAPSRFDDPAYAAGLGASSGQL